MKNKLLLLFFIFLLVSCKVNSSSINETNSITNSLSYISESTSIKKESSSTSSLLDSSSSTSNVSSSLNSITNSIFDSISSNLSSINNSTSSTTLNEVDIDPIKLQFSFDETLKYDDFYNELSNKNFTVNIELGNREIYVDNTTIYEPLTYETIAIDEGVFYHKIDHIEEDKYIYDSLEIAKIINNQVYIALVNLSDNSIEYSKIPLESFYDTFIAKYISIPFAYLSESEDGGFLNSTLDFYVKEYSEYIINDDNSFTLETYNYYFHPEFTHSEVTYYTYYNIGNTKISINENIFSNTNYDDYKIRDFEYEGVEYSCYDGVFIANISISYFDLIYVSKGAHIIHAEIFNIPVTTIYFPYYVYNKNFEGYEYNVYFDEDLIYQDKYSYIGEVDTAIGTSRYDAIDFFIENNGKFNYFDTW